MTYSTEQVQLARQLHDHDWTVEAIRGHIERQCGQRPEWRTVKRWVDDAYDQRIRESSRVLQRESARKRAGGLKPRTVSADHMQLRVAQLHELGLGPKTIAAVAGVFFTDPPTPHQVRSALHQRTSRAQPIVKRICACGTEFETTGQRGRPRKQCKRCAPPKRAAA